MGYINVINEFIKEVIIEREEDYLIEWEKDDFLKEDIPYISLSMNKVDEDEIHLKVFNSYNYNYDDLVLYYRQPTPSEYHNILIEIAEEFGLESDEIINTSFENMMEKYICIRALRIISEYNEEKKNSIIQEIKERKKAILIIQRAFRKYRYNPKYKYCKLIEIQNLFLIKVINEKDFKKYIEKEKIYNIIK